MKRLLLLTAIFLGLLAPVPAYAYNPLDSACHIPGASGSSACSATGQDTLTGPAGIFRKVSLFLAFLASICAVILIIVGGFQYVLSSGDPQKATSARNMIVGALVGLVIIAASESILLFVIRGLS